MKFLKSFFSCGQVSEDDIQHNKIPIMFVDDVAEGVVSAAQSVGSMSCAKVTITATTKMLNNKKYENRPEKVITDEYWASYGPKEKGRGQLNKLSADCFPSLGDEHLIRRFGEYMAMAYFEKADKVSALSKLNLRVGNFKVVSHRNDEEGNLLYFIATNVQQKTTVLVLRGSVTKVDFYLDILGQDIEPDFNILSAGLKKEDQPRVHRGFWERFTNYRKVIAKDVQKALSSSDGQKTSFFVVGHSLGASWAFLQAADLVQNFSVPLRGCYLYGMPETSNQTYADALTRTIGLDKVIRIVNWNDMVPHIGMGPGGTQPQNVPEYFYEVGATEVLVCTGGLKNFGSLKLDCKTLSWDHHSDIGGWSMRKEFARLKIRTPDDIYDV